jgi:hypothetical protein
MENSILIAALGTGGDLHAAPLVSLSRLGFENVD